MSGRHHYPTTSSSTVKSFLLLPPPTTVPLHSYATRTWRSTHFGFNTDCFTPVQQTVTVNRCLLCRATRKTFWVNGHGPFCAVHGKEYKHSSKNCHLSDFEGDGARGRWKLNEDIFNYCKELRGHRGLEYFLKVLHLYSHMFAGELEIKRRVQHVKKFFGGVFDDAHTRRCQAVAKKVPPVFCATEKPGEAENEETHYMRIALACFLEHRRENGLPTTFGSNDSPEE